jgi:hypothetical protein
MKAVLLVAGLALAQLDDAGLHGMTVEALLACSGDSSRCSASDWDLDREAAQPCAA